MTISPKAQAKHPSHVTRSSDASTFDEVCINCGATDQVPGGWGKLAEPCPVAEPLQAERDAAAPKLPDDLAGLVTELRDAARLNAGPLGPEARAEHRALTAIQSLVERNAELEMGLEDLLSWFPDKPSEPEWRIKAGNYGADAAVSIARSLLNKDRQP